MAKFLQQKIVSIKKSVQSKNRINRHNRINRTNRMNHLTISLLLLCSAALLRGQTPTLAQRLQAQQEALRQAPYVLRLPAEGLSAQQAQAQAIALADTALLALTREPGTLRLQRSEVFAVYAARPSDYGVAPACADGSCYRVEIYNYAQNSSVVAMVQLSSGKVLRMGQQPQAQPELPGHLKNLALHIATESPLVAEALGFKPEPGSALMADTKTALNRSRCERSKHLCVAPTFVQGSKALWVIVDLTDLKVVATRWTQVGEAGPMPTERRVQNAEMTECYCLKSNALERDGWALNYILTSNDGLRISEVRYQGRPVIRNAKLVDWHVSYSNTDGFGYSDGVGCPVFSSSAVVAIEKPRVYELLENGQSAGFVLAQNYASEGWPTNCNYNYEQRYEFYRDGRFRMAVGSLGRGCGNNGTYRPVSRIVFEGQNRFEEWSGADWKAWAQEGWQLQRPTTPYTPEGYQYRIGDPQQGRGFALVANTGQMPDGGRGDDAYTYVTVDHPERDEGESDLLTIGPCCNTDHRQGPEKFMEPQAEPLEAESGGRELVLWYVPQMRNDDRPGRQYCWAEQHLLDGVYQPVVYPCFSGPLFVPLR
jgi:hypothetical protein